MMDYYVYEVYYCGILAYIGQGQGNRTAHVHSGRSHNKFLNEVHSRSLSHNEPKAEVRIRKRFKTKAEAVKSEKWSIGRFNPMFNDIHSKPWKSSLFSADERKKLEDIGEDFLAAVDVFDVMCISGKVNPKFALTPIGAQMWGVPSIWGGVCSNLAGLSLVGKCEQIQNYFDWVFVGAGLVKVWLKTSVMREVVGRLGSEHYVFEVVQKPTGMPFVAYSDFQQNRYGSLVPSGYWEHKKQGLILCRTVGERTRVKMVLSLYDTDNGYKVVCENNQQLIYESRVMGAALSVYRGSNLKGKEFVLFHEGHTTPMCPIDMSCVVDFNAQPVDSNVCAPFNGMYTEWSSEDKQNLFDALNEVHVATAEDDVYDQIQMPTMVWEGLE